MLSVPLALLDEPWKLSMGVRTLDIRHWLVLDDRWEEEIRERRRLSHHCRNLVYDMLPAAEPACRELRSTGYAGRRQTASSVSGTVFECG
jgi:hypothetical protein